MAEIKVLALDLDGTLTSDQKEVTPRTRAALDELVPTIERANRWARIEGVEVTDLPAKDREYGFTVRSGE